MDITKVSKLSGLPASTLRFYEEKGLIQSLGRHGLKRVFKSSVLEQLNLITLGRNVGLSLDEIGEMLTARGLEVNRGLLLSKADELDEKIKELKAMSKGLRHAAACDARNHLECPKFLRFLKIASKNRSKNKNKNKNRKRSQL